jgi:hypothetical protein
MSDFDPLDQEALELAQLALKEKQHAERLKEKEDFKWLMSHERGRRVVHRLLERSGVYRSDFIPDTNESYFRGGDRNAGVRLMAFILEHCPDRYPQMILEHRYEQYSDLV